MTEGNKNTLQKSNEHLDFRRGGNHLFWSDIFGITNHLKVLKADNIEAFLISTDHQLWIYSSKSVSFKRNLDR